MLLKIDDRRGGIAPQRFSLLLSAPNAPPAITSSPGLSAVPDLPCAYSVHAQDAEGVELLFGTYRRCFQYASDHWFMHRGQLADARRAAGVQTNVVLI